MICPCGSQKEYTMCCEPFIKGQKKARTAEELMRARYSAYSQKEIDFIEQTHDPKTRKSFDRSASEQWAQSTDWQGLEIISTEQGQKDNDFGVVEFKAEFDAGDGTQIHKERSEFNKRNGSWYFTDSKNPSVTTIRRDEPKVGRNDPCPCGSGKKYKKCCGTA